MDTKTMLELPIDGMILTMTTVVTGKTCDENKVGSHPLTKTDKDGNVSPVMKDNKQVYVEFPPTTVSLKCDMAGNKLHHLVNGVAAPQVAIKWANKARPRGKQYCLDNQTFVYSDFFVREAGFGGDPTTRANNAVDKIDELDDLQALMEKVQAKIKLKKSA